MYAVVANGGKQYKVTEGQTLVVDRLNAEVGSTVSLGDVVLLGGDEVKVGAPTVDGAEVTVEVVSHDLDDKRSTYRYNRTRRFRVSRASRPRVSTVKVTGIKG